MVCITINSYISFKFANFEVLQTNKETAPGYSGENFLYMVIKLQFSFINVFNFVS